MNLYSGLRGLANDRQPERRFRLRLRAEVLNRWVAAREGLTPTPQRRFVGGEMGPLGRVCLHASVAVGVAAAGVLAVSQDAIPGEPLYALKLRIEELRVEVLPGHLHDDLALNVLSERIDEIRRLSGAGSIDAALALAPVIKRDYAEVQARFASAGSFGLARLEQRFAIFSRLVSSMPPDVREMLSSLIPELARDRHGAIPSSARSELAQRTG